MNKKPFAEENQLYKNALNKVGYNLSATSLLKAIEENYPIEYNILKERLKSYKESEYTEELIKSLFQKAWGRHHNGYYWIKDLLTEDREKEIVFINFVEEKVLFIGIMQKYDLSYDNIKILSSKLNLNGNNSERAKREAS